MAFYDSCSVFYGNEFFQEKIMERCTVATHRFKKDLKSCSTKNILKTLQEFITFRLRHKEFNPNSAFADWIDGLRGEDYQMF